MLMLSFNNRILLWSLYTRELMNHPIFFEEISKGQLFSIIRPKLFDIHTKLSFNKTEKIRNNTVNIRFMLKHVDPREPCAIIY